MVLAFSYGRFSSKPQEKGHSRERQDAIFTATCAKHGLTAATKYFDDGRSAYKKGKQRDLEEFLSLVEQGEIEKDSWLVVESQDRISRLSIDDTYELIRRLLKRDITIFIAQPYERKLTKNSLNEIVSILSICIEAERSNRESEMKSIRVSAAWANKLTRAGKEKLTARGPAWLVFDPETRLFTIDNSKAQVIKRIFSLTTKQGLGSRALAKLLNTEKVPTFTGGEKWGWAYVRLIITDRRVLGEFTSTTGTPPIPNYYPQVIDNKTFLKAQALTNTRTRFRGATSERVSNIFTGLAWDTQTQTTMVYVRKSKDNAPRFVPSHYELNKVKGSHSFPYEVFETEFLKLVNELKPSDIGKETAADTSEIEKMDNQIVALDNRIAAIRKELENLSGSSPAELVHAITTMDNERKETITQRDNVRAELHLSSSKEGLQQSKTVLEELRDATGPELIDLRLRLRQAIRGLVERIDCTLTKKGWLTSIQALIRFRSGEKRRMGIIVRRGELVVVVNDLDKWRETKPKKEVIIQKEFEGAILASLERLANKKKEKIGRVVVQGQDE